MEPIFIAGAEWYNTNGPSARAVGAKHKLDLYCKICRFRLTASRFEGAFDWCQRIRMQHHKCKGTVQKLSSLDEGND